MDNLVETRLGNEAIEYIQRRLLDEGKTVAKHIYQSINLDRGSVSTLLPDYVPAAAAKDLRNGVLRRDPASFQYVEGAAGRRYRVEPVPNVNESLVAKISSSLPARSWIFEEWAGRAPDPWFQRGMTDTSWMLLGEEIYWVVEENASFERIEATVRRASSTYPGLLGFGISDNDLAALGFVGAEMNASTPELIARNLSEIAVGAYDGEAFIYWTPV